MHRTLPYLALFAVVVLLQVFLFDNLSISIYLNPLVYVAFIALLPLDTPPIRPTLLGLLYPRDDIREGGIPSTGRLGNRVFLNYLIVLVLVHHAVFFSLEALSWAHIVRTIVRTVASGAVSVAFIWVIARIFTAKLPVRI